MEPQVTKAKIVQLNRTRVKLMGEMRDVSVKLASNSKVHHVIDVIVVDILDSYGILLSRDWSLKLGGYFTMDWK